ncbi:hypothetical protein, partial [Clostridioides difficile]|uniref:hypothetical protein n=1 Tax=Clostridioides difficile TaxID=1496 RepID=UPI00295E5F0D
SRGKGAMCRRARVYNEGKNVKKGGGMVGDNGIVLVMRSDNYQNLHAASRRQRRMCIRNREGMIQNGEVNRQETG